MESFLDSGAFCGLLVAALVAMFIGNRLTEGHETLRRLGALSAAVTFLGAVGWSLQRGAQPADLGSVTLQAAVLAGTVLGMSWIALAVLRGLWCEVFGSLLSRADRWQEAWRRRQEAERARRRAEAGQRAEEAMRREQERRGQDKHAQQEEATRRCATARAACEILYALHAPDISQRFSKEMFDDFVQRHLGDDRPPEYVEQRAQQLQQVIAQHVAKARPSRQESTIEETMAAYTLEVERIQAAGLDPEWAETLLLKLRDQLFERLLRRTENP